MAEIIPLTIKNIGFALQLSRTEKWNQTREDWELIVKNPQNVCLAAEIDGKLIGTATAVNYGNRIAWIGMVLVDRGYRGQGVSKLLLSALFKQLTPIPSIKLDATPKGQVVYKKFGFKKEYSIHRMTAGSVMPKPLSNEKGTSPELIFPNNYAEVVEFDKQIFGADRSHLIQFLVKNNPENTWMIRRNGKISGVAMGRKGSRYYQVGPVLTSTITDAKILIMRALEGSEGQSTVVDVPDDKKELRSWLGELGFAVQRHFVRMYQDDNPYPGIPERQFLICGPEFG